MINDFKTYYRKIIHQKIFFGINLVGLTIGITFALLAFLYTQNEFKYDKHFTNTDDVYLLSCNNGRQQKMHRGQPPVFMDKILNDVPEVKQGLRIKWSDENMKINGQRMEAIDFSYADSDFFNFLGWGLVEGDPSTVLANPMSLTISKKMARQLFKDEDPVGQIVNIGNKYDYTITGIFRDFPNQAYIDVDFIASLNSWQHISRSMMQDWGWHSSWIYLKVPDKANISQLEKKLANVWNQETRDEHCKGDYIKTYLQPFKDNYLHSGDITGLADPMTNIISFSLIAAMILLISSFNFMNLSIAMNGQRTMDQHIKKVLGANIKQLMRQIFFEIIIYLFLALLVSSLILKVWLPILNNFLGKHLVLSFWNNPVLIAYVFILMTVLLVVFGLSSVFQIRRLRNQGVQKQVFTSFLLTSKTQKRSRNLFVTAQFAIGIILIASTLVVNQQLKLIREHDTGFDREHTLVIDNYEGNKEKRYQLMTETLKKYPDVLSVSCGTNIPPGGVSNWGGASVVGDQNQSMEGVGFVSVDYNYLDLIGAEFLQGRNFIPNRSSDIDQVIITETMAKDLNLVHPIGTILTNMWDDKQRQVIGVVKDIEYETIHEPSLPLAFFCRRSTYINYCKQMVVKLKSGNYPKILSSIKKEWGKVSPEYPLSYRFLDDIFNTNYKEEIKTGKILGFMTFVAILLSGMGLFALALFHINARIKEIGIRKVNGAKISEVMTMLNRDFIKWVAIAFVVATPLAYYAMNKWLENFAYKTTLSWWIFVLSGLLALGIALLTVSFQSWKAATRNPVEALRYE